jgi:hypothetical protein
MYSVVSFSRTRFACSLADAWRVLRECNGIGAIFRGVPGAYDRPIYPKARTI